MSLLRTWEAPHDRSSSSPTPRWVAPRATGLGRAGRHRARFDRDRLDPAPVGTGRRSPGLHLRLDRHRRVRVWPAAAVLLALRGGRRERAALLALAAQLRRTRADVGHVAR